MLRLCHPTTDDEASVKRLKSEFHSKNKITIEVSGGKSADGATEEVTTP